MERRCPYAPPAEYDRIRAENPVSQVELPTGKRAWVLTRHEDVRAMLTDPRFSSDRANPQFPSLVDNTRMREVFKPSLISMDPPEHGPARRAVVGEFTVRRMEALRPRIQEIVDQAIDDLLAAEEPADLVTHLSLPVPSLVICELLGVPYADHEFFQQHSGRLLSRETTPEERRHAVDQLTGYLDKLIVEKEAAPTDDLLGRQIVKHREENNNVDHEALVSLAFLLLIAGHETTANMISLGVVALLEHPEQLKLLRDDPGVTLSAVEELLRYFTIAELATTRLATEDVEIGGVLIKAGEGVIGLSNAANHDPAAYERPDELDIARGARNHVAFGFGAHQCLGQNLARMELQIVFDTLFRRVPSLRIARPIDELDYKRNSTVYGLHSLPVAWT
ncbi:cytochrome P450 [Amycolatopsis lurida]